MNIFGINFITKKELKKELTQMKEVFPFSLGQTVYDVQLKNDKGRYTKTRPSREYSTISEVVVDTRNYFSLVERFKRNDVFTEYEDAVVYLDLVCTK
jgi:hypothetical protein